jgi:hypothetical protein
VVLAIHVHPIYVHSTPIVPHTGAANYIILLTNTSFRISLVYAFCQQLLVTKRASQWNVFLALVTTCYIICLLLPCVSKWVPRYLNDFVVGN